MNISFGNKIQEGSFTQVLEGTKQENGILQPIVLRLLKDARFEPEILTANYFSKYLSQDPHSSPFFTRHFGLEKVNGSLALISEVAKGSLHDFIQRPEDNVPLKAVAIVIKSIAGALAFLEKETIIYSHLDPKKILFFDDGIKLDCFAQMYFQSAGTRVKNFRRNESYASPSSLLNFEDSFKTPIWSLAQIAKELFTKVMYRSQKKEELLASFRHLLGESNFRSISEMKSYKDSKEIDLPEIEPLTDLIKRVALEKQENQEETEDFLNLLLKMFDYDNPISAEEMLSHPFLLNFHISDHNPSLPKKAELKNKFDRARKLGGGTFGEVYAVKLKGNERVEYALKMSKFLQDENARQDSFQSILDEDRFLRLLERDPESESYLIKREGLFKQSGRMHLVLEIASSNLLEYIRRKPISLKEAKTLGGNLFKALVFLFKHKVIHSDIKPENILIRKDGVAVLADFGESCFEEDASHLRSYIITRWYRPPEIALEMPFTAAVDVWSLASTLIESVLNKVAFEAKNNEDLIKFHEARMGSYPKSLLGKASEDTLKIYETLKLSPLEPLHLSDFIKNGYKGDDVEPFIDFLEKALTLDPNQRPSADDLLKEPFLNN